MKIFFCIISVVILQLNSIRAQNDSTIEDKIEIYIIDSYITPELPHKLIILFFTSDSTTSKILLQGQKEIQVSKKFTDNHRLEIDLSALPDLFFPLKYTILFYDYKEEEFQSQIYEVDIPQNMIIETDRNFGFKECCFGGIVFGLPSPAIVFYDNEIYWSLAKEIPLLSFFSGGYNYPYGYFGVEYEHVFKSAYKNFFRIGYKQIFQLNLIKYFSLGINYFTDFRGYNGINPEASFGLFQIQNIFTLFVKYRYNFQPNKSYNYFHEISIGLYSNLFSINF